MVTLRNTISVLNSPNQLSTFHTESLHYHFQVLGWSELIAAHEQGPLLQQTTTMSSNIPPQQQPQQQGDAAAATSTSNVPVKQECLVPGKGLWVLWRTNFEIDQHYIPIKVICFVW
jgi:hypothetical protein